MFDFLLIVILVLIIGMVALKGLTIVGDNQVGIVTKNMFGQSLPEGHIIATKGEVGVQANILMPGLYWFIPVIYSVEKTNVTKVNTGSIGIVESVDGKPIPQGRIIGDEIECNSFQDAKTFLENGGYKGAQVGVLRPGVYRINTKVFKIQLVESVKIPTEKLGIVTAKDGIPLPSNRVIAPSPTASHKHFQDGQAFLNNGGYRGPQLETLQSGEYYINSLLFNVMQYEISEVPAGYVAVIVSSVGEDIVKTPKAPATDVPPELDQPIHDAIETPLITDKNTRGIIKEPVAPGRYNLNPVAYKPVLVPTSAVTIKWGTETEAGDTKIFGREGKSASDRTAEFYEYSQLRTTSKDGFQLDVDVKLIIRVSPANASYIISRFGSVNNLIEQVVHPLIDSSFRNEAGNRSAMEFIHSRTTLQKDALEKAREEFKKYQVEVQGLLIAYIRVDQALLDTQTKKQIAEQQQKQYEEEAKAQESRIAVSEKTARADKQRDIIAAKLSIDIERDNADAMRRKAEGERDAIKIVADGKAFEAKTVGEAQADAYKAQTDVLGADKIAIIKLMDSIGEKKINITPNVFVSGGQSGGDNLLFNTMMASLLNDKNKVIPVSGK